MHILSQQRAIEDLRNGVIIKEVDGSTLTEQLLAVPPFKFVISEKKHSLFSG